MSYTPLNRKFNIWRDDGASTADLALFERSFSGEAGWADLLKHQRVVVLAEAGSGKSMELSEQAARLTKSGEFAFHATVQNVAKEGLSDALGFMSKSRFDEWRRSDKFAWFFIDSIDEAKLDHIRLEDALRHLADDIGDNLPRSRIVISGRYNNWEFKSDLRRLTEALPIAKLKTEVPEETRDPLIEIIHRDGMRKKQEPAEKPLVVLMAPLDQERVRAFATGQGINDLDDFIAALDNANLWSLAKRPLDLGWLVDYWQKNHRFGRFAEMLETSIRERLSEPNASRAGRDVIDVDRALEAVERIGATMVFGREVRIELPDSELAQVSTPAVKLREILPDWSGDHQGRLLTRPVFEPASLGRVQLHNDNRGIVRGFLAAKWLLHRRKKNAPISKIFDLLFADASGTPIVLLSCQETAAWLSIWDNDVASMVIARAPALLLMAGDPGSLSSAIRATALQGVVKKFATGENRHEMLDRDTVKRFSLPDLVPIIRESWAEHKNHQEVRRLLLNVIELGRLNDCVAIAKEAVSGSFSDRSTLLFGSSALAVTGTDEELQSYAEYLKSVANATDDAVVWEVIDLLFPKFISVADMLFILGELKKRQGTDRNFRWRARTIIERLTSTVDLETLLQGLMDLVGSRECDDGNCDDDTAMEKWLAPLIQAAASMLLKLTPMHQANQLVIDASFRLADRFKSRTFKDDEFYPMLVASPERRRHGLWRAAEKLQDHPRIKQWGLTSIFQLNFAGWSAGLKQEDVTWLIQDARGKSTLLERRLAVDALMGIWRDVGSPALLLRRIREVAAIDEESAKFVQGWLTPRKLSDEEIQLNRKINRLKRDQETKQKKHDKSWVEFVDRMKSDPEQLRTPPSNLKTGSIDARLFYIWELLYDSSDSDTEYALDGFGELSKILGADLIREVRAALIRFWRGHKPTLTSSRKPDERNQISMIDRMGITGISLEAKVDPTWAANLTFDEATTAAQLSTQELNGFPHWLKQLVAAKPVEVRQVFLGEVNNQLAVAPGQHGFIDKFAQADPEFAALVAPSLIKHVADRPQITEVELSKVMDVIGRALPVIQRLDDFGKLILERFDTTTSERTAALYLEGSFRIDPNAAIEALRRKLDGLDFPGQKRLAEFALPRVFGDRMFRTGVDPKILPFDVLESLVNMAFKTIRLEDDNVHEGAYSPDDRDSAESARSALFHQLLATPGRVTLDALKRLGSEPDFPISQERLRQLILQRASEDAEHAPWTPFEALKMETEFDTEPRTPRDLQLAALRRISDIDYSLHHGDFAQGQTVKMLPNEREVQKWMANELKHRQGRAYTLTRESHVADEKEPDIRLQSNAAEASIPIEIKVVESWTLTQLEYALSGQLSGRYLREKDKRHGVLLLIHQNARTL